MGARQESEPTQTTSGPESLSSTTSPRSALSAAERSAGDLERPQNKAGPAWEEHRKIFGYRLLSGASRSRTGSGNSRGRGKRQPAAFLPYFYRKITWTRAFACLAFNEQNALPSTSERITLTQNSLTSVIDCGTPSKLPPKCTKCCAVFAVNGILQNQAYLSSKRFNQVKCWPLSSFHSSCRCIKPCI